MSASSHYPGYNSLHAVSLADQQTALSRERESHGIATQIYRAQDQFLRQRQSKIGMGSRRSWTNFVRPKRSIMGSWREEFGLTKQRIQILEAKVAEAEAMENGNLANVEAVERAAVDQGKGAEGQGEAVVAGKEREKSSSAAADGRSETEMEQGAD